MNAHCSCTYLKLCLGRMRSIPLHRSRWPRTIDCGQQRFWYRRTASAPICHSDKKKRKTLINNRSIIKIAQSIECFSLPRRTISRTNCDCWFHTNACTCNCMRGRKNRKQKFVCENKYISNDYLKRNCRLAYMCFRWMDSLCANALQRLVLPVPGGPWSSTNLLHDMILASMFRCENNIIVLANLRIYWKENILHIRRNR